MFPPRNIGVVVLDRVAILNFDEAVVAFIVRLTFQVVTDTVRIFIRYPVILNHVTGGFERIDRADMTPYGFLRFPDTGMTLNFFCRQFYRVGWR